MQGPELALGFVVNGVPMLSSDHLLSKRGLEPGDCLVLTKPLGTGVLFAGNMQLAADGRDIAAAVSSMVLSNRLAAELAVSRGVSACTDITGFGLLGHLLEMLGDDLRAQLELAALPLLHGALPLMAAGYSSTLQASNAALCAQSLGRAALGEPRAKMLFDPQTSGGLLLGIAQGKASELCIALRGAGYEDTAIIGQVASGSEGGDQQVAIY
jgi:selenide,water dikinase